MEMAINLATNSEASGIAKEPGLQCVKGNKLGGACSPLKVSARRDEHSF